MKTKLTAVVLAMFALGMVASVSAQDKSSDNTVTANVTSTVALDVKPESLSYPSLTVGSLTETSNRSFDGIDIANVGSEYLDRIWLGSSVPSERPFGTGDPDAYDAGNFLVAKPDNKTGLDTRGNNTVFHYINRREYADSNPPTFLQGKLDTGAAPVNDNFVRARFGDQWFFVDIVTQASGSSAVCDGGSSAELRIGTVPHTTDSLGTYDFTNDGSKDGQRYQNISINELSNSKYGVSGQSVTFDMTNGESSEEYDILTACEGTSGVDSTHIVLSKYNVAYNDTVDLQSNAPGTATTDILDAGSPGTMLTPGESFKVDLGMEVPRGVSAGQVQSGTLTVYATADKSAEVS